MKILRTFEQLDFLKIIEGLAMDSFRNIVMVMDKSSGFDDTLTAKMIHEWIRIRDGLGEQGRQQS